MKPSYVPVRVSYKLAHEHLERVFLESGRALPRTVRYDLEEKDLQGLGTLLRWMLVRARLVRFPAGPTEAMHIRLGELPEEVYTKEDVTLRDLVQSSLYAAAKSLIDALPRPWAKRRPDNPPPEARLLTVLVANPRAFPGSEKLVDTLLGWALAYTEGGSGPWADLAREIVEIADGSQSV